MPPDEDIQAVAPASEPDPPPASPEPSSDDPPYDKDKAMATIAAQRASEKAAKAEARKAAEERDAALLRLKSFEDAQKSDLEKLEDRASQAERDAADWKGKYESLQEEHRRALIRHEVLMTATHGEVAFRDPEDVLRFFEPTDFELDDAGLPKPTAVKTKLKKLLEERPYLAAGTADATAGNGHAQGVPPLPKPDRDGDPSLDQGAQKRAFAQQVRRWW